MTVCHGALDCLRTGEGRTAEWLCAIGATMDLDIVVDDPRADRERYPAAFRLLTEDYVVIAPQHKGDHHQSMQRALYSRCAKWR